MPQLEADQYPGLSPLVLKGHCESNETFAKTGRPYRYRILKAGREVASSTVRGQAAFYAGCSVRLCLQFDLGKDPEVSIEILAQEEERLLARFWRERQALGGLAVLGWGYEVWEPLEARSAWEASLNAQGLPGRDPALAAA